MKIWLYGKLKSIRIFNGLLMNIEHSMSVLYPGSGRDIINKTMSVMIKVIMSDIILTLILFLTGIKIYYIIVAVIFMYFVTGGIIKKIIYRLETELLIKEEKLISDFRYKYQILPVVEDALREAVECSEQEMVLHGQLLLEHLESLNEDKEDDYEENAANGYLLTLYALCKTVQMYGDRKTEKGSAFLENLSYLKEELHIEILKRKKIMSVFSGLSVLSLFPILAIRPVEIWSISNMPELEQYFNSVSGRVITVLLGLISICIYRITVQLKYPPGNIGETKSKLITLSHKGIIDRMIVKYMSINYKKAAALNTRLKNMAYKYNVREFIFYRIIMAFLLFFIGCTACITIGISLIISPFFLILGYYIPYISVIINENIIKMNREEEIIRFQNIILIMINSQSINVHMILERMESFAIVFKSYIQYLYDEYPNKGTEVFEIVRDECGYRPFERLMESFMACDNVPVENAFEDLKSDRRFYMEKHKQDNEIILENKGAIARFLAFIPLYGIVIMKLIIPFAIEGIKMMENGFSI